jgi:hypothetical protein
MASLPEVSLEISTPGAASTTPVKKILFPKNFLIIHLLGNHDKQ